MKKYFYPLIALLCVCMTACSSDSESTESQYADTEASAFTVYEAGATYATIELSVDRLERVYLANLGVPNGNISDYINSSGVSSEDWARAVSRLFYIELSEYKSGYQTETVYGTVDKWGGVTFKMEYLKPGTTYRYWVYQLSSDGTYTHYHDAYTFTTKSIEEAGITVKTGTASISRTVGSTRYIRAEMNDIVLKGFTDEEIDKLQYGVIMSEEKQDISPLKATSFSRSEKWKYASPDPNYSRWDSSGKATVRFTVQLNNRRDVTCYYCAFLKLGETYIAGDVKEIEL